MLNRTDVSNLELFWTIPAIVAFLVTMAAIFWVGTVFHSLRTQILLEPSRYRAWGPRWNFLVFLGTSLIFFALGWAGYAILGLVAMTTPPNPNPENREAATMLAYILIGMEGAHALAQVFLVGGLFALAGLWNFPFEFWKLRK